VPNFSEGRRIETVRRLSEAIESVESAIVLGTHMDADKHIRGPEAPGVEGIPLEYCFSDAVRLDFRHKEPGSRVFPDEIDDDLPFEFDAAYWDALLPDDDYEPHPEPGDFWIDDDDPT